MNHLFKLYSSILTVLLVGISTTQLSSVLPSDDGVVYAYSNNSQAQSSNDECEYDESSGFNCVFSGPLIIGNDTVTTRPPPQISSSGQQSPLGPPGSPEDDSTQTIVIPHDEYNKKIQEVLKNALND